LVAQPYKAAFKLDRAQAFADEHGLTVSVVEGFESWYWPGECLIVVWRKGCLPPQTRGRLVGPEASRPGVETSRRRAERSWGGR
jgi:hypothetical protein